MRVVIAGAGSIGRELAGDLFREKDNEIVFIDTDESKCEKVSEEFDALVLNGDATNPDILKKAQISEADALIALTDNDAINTVIAMLGNRFEVKKIIVKLNDLSLRSACEEVGVKKIVTPKISASAEIYTSLFGLEHENLSLVVKGGIRLVTLEVNKAVGKKISDLDFPDGTHIIAIKKEDTVKLPRKEIKLSEDDELLILIEKRELLDKLKKILGAED